MMGLRSPPFRRFFPLLPLATLATCLALLMAAFVRVSGPPNSNFLVGYPGISATLPRIEGKVEVRPLVGVGHQLRDEVGIE